MPWESEFQSTRPRGARHAGADARAGGGRVSIHAPARGATGQLSMSSPKSMFQSTRPRGARLVQLAADADDSQFQSTRPRGARRFGLSRIQRSDRFQSTRPRGARRGAHPGGNGRTEFQSTRPRGARRGSLGTKRRLPSFNPRARVGRDLIRRAFAPAALVSIHAPAWGATVS